MNQYKLEANTRSARGAGKRVQARHDCRLGFISDRMTE